MSNGKGLSIIALIIGVSGLSLGIYTLVIPPVQVVDTNFGIQQTWLNYDSTIYTTDPVATTIIIHPFTINFTVNLGESVYFLFTTYATVFAPAIPGFTSIQINFVLDGVTQYPPDFPHVTFTSDDLTLYGSVSLQMAKNIPLGFHNITMAIFGSETINKIAESTLLVQTYIP